MEAAHSKRVVLPFCTFPGLAIRKALIGLADVFLRPLKAQTHEQQWLCHHVGFVPKRTRSMRAPH
jgi:hypothetical protein